jgi:murein DD-endopeptidase MepM/ murein hydrolase activator NlpD
VARERPAEEDRRRRPDNTYAIAPFAGRIVLAGNSPTGMRVWLRHESGWNAGFFHMDRLKATPGSDVLVGAPIGRVNDSPRGDDPDHLHFELYWGDILDDVKHGRYPRGTVDPELMLVSTPYLPAA